MAATSSPPPISITLPIQIHKISCSEGQVYYLFYLPSCSGSGQEPGGTKADPESHETDLRLRLGPTMIPNMVAEEMLQNDLWIHFHIPATILTIHTVPAVDWDMVGCWRNPRQNNISSELHYQPCCISKFAQEQVLNFLCIDLLTPPTVPDMQGIILGHSRNPMRQPHLRLQFQPPSTFLPIQIHKVSCSDFKDYYPFYLSSRSGSGQDGSGTKADSEFCRGTISASVWKSGLGTGKRPEPDWT